MMVPFLFRLDGNQLAIVMIIRVDDRVYDL